MSEVAKGFRRWRFFDLSDSDKRDMLKLMARVAEQAYRLNPEAMLLVSKTTFLRHHACREARWAVKSGAGAAPFSRN